ncbi:hypothetical protein OSL06_16800, partial [Escherichia coli]|uniref:JAB domain-containing protein n=1 Tax=Escherichia coli TaxID=562 RepID=UPI0023019955|nr:hypothetical protein [Escherichia coli]
DRNRSHWSTSKTPSYTKSVSWQHHPGCAEPSKADKLITERIIKSCQFMDLRVLDHIVIGRGEYVSFAERGWI